MLDLRVSPLFLSNPIHSSILSIPMSSQNPWSVLAVFAEELAPVAQSALDAVASVANAVVRADIRVEGTTSAHVLPPSHDAE